MNTLVLYDVPQQVARRRAESVLRSYGFVWLFPHVRWSTRPFREHRSLTTRLRIALRGEAYRVLFIEIAPNSRINARWITATPKRQQP